MARLPGKLKTFSGLINFTLLLDPLAGGDFAHDVDIFARSFQWPIENSAVPAGDRLVGHAQSEQQSAAGKALPRRRLNAKRHRTAAVNMIDRRAELDCLRPARYRRTHHDRSGANGVAVPERAVPALLR